MRRIALKATLGSNCETAIPLLRRAAKTKQSIWMHGRSFTGSSTLTRFAALPLCHHDSAENTKYVPIRRATNQPEAHDDYRRHCVAAYLGPSNSCGGTDPPPVRGTENQTAIPSRDQIISSRRRTVVGRAICPPIKSSIRRRRMGPLSRPRRRISDGTMVPSYIPALRSSYIASFWQRACPAERLRSAGGELTVHLQHAISRSAASPGSPRR